LTLIACSRMYNVTPRARQAWASLFTWVSETSGVELEIVDHPAPAPLEDLWARPDMGCVFMCGWPFGRAEPQPRPIAAPIPSGDRYRGRPSYFTDLIVRRDRGYRTLEDTFGGRIAWTVDASHSGFNAPRHHLLGFRTGDRPRLYRESIGPVLTPSGALACVVDGMADVAPMDSYALDLIRLHQPERVAEISVIDSTNAALIPPLVAATEIDTATRAGLRRAFLAAGTDPIIAAVIADLGLTGFAAVEADEYGLAVLWEQEALSAGYRRPE
jgi:ABC-type phosphate/phosphonate transport system substrate-binding protein